MMLSTDNNQTDLQHLVATLISVFPEACRRRDPNGALPLQRILPCRPSLELVVQMIVAHPDAAMEERQCSLPPRDPYASRIQELLQQAERALLRTRQEAGLWFLLGVQGLGPPPEESGRVSDAASLLQSAYFRLSLRQMMGDNAEDDTDAQALEPLLKNLLARNEAYGDILLALSQERFNSSETSLLSNDVPGSRTEEEYYALQDENGYLKKRIFGLEMTLRDLGYNNKNNDDFSPHLDIGETMSVMGMDPERPSALAKYMETKVTELQEEMDGLENENERLTAQVEELQSLLNNLERKSSEVELEDGHSVRSKLLSVHSSDDRNDVHVSVPIFEDTPASTPTSSDNGSGHDKDQSEKEVTPSLPVTLNHDNNTPLDDSGNNDDFGMLQQERMELVEEKKRLETQNETLMRRVQELEASRDDNSDRSDSDDSMEGVSSGHVRLDEENGRLQLENKRLLQKIENLENVLEESARVRESADEGESLSTTVNSLSAAVESHSAEVTHLHKQLEELSNEAVKKEDALKQEIFKLRQELANAQKENRELKDHRNEPAEIASSRYEIPDDSYSTTYTERSALLGETLKEIDRLSGHDGEDHIEDEDVSCSTPSSEPSVAVSLALSSAISSPHSLYGSEKFGSKASSSYTRSHNNSLSSGKTVSNRSTSSWAALSATQQFGKRKGRRPRKLKSLVKVLPKDSNFMESFHNSLPDLASSFFRDDLGSILKTAAELYHDFGGQNRELLAAGIETQEVILASLNANATELPSKTKQKRRYSDGGASPLVLLHEKTLSETDRNDNLEQTALLLTFEDDMLFIISRAEEILDSNLPENLVSALQESCFLHLDASNHRSSRHSIPEGILDSTLIEQVETVHGKAISEQVLCALCEASRELIETSKNEILAMEKMKDRLEQEFLDALIDAAQSKLSHSIPIDLIASLRTAAASFGQLLEESVDESRNDYAIQVDFHRLDVLFKEAEGLYGRRFPGKILVALREASFVLQSRLDGTDLAGSVWDLSSRGDLNESMTRPSLASGEMFEGTHITSQAQSRQFSTSNESSSAWSEPLAGRDSAPDPDKSHDQEEGKREITLDSRCLPEAYGDDFEDDVDDIKSHGTTSKASDDMSIDILAVFTPKRNDTELGESAGKLDINKKGLVADKERIKSRSEWAEDGTPAYVPPSQRGRSPRRKAVARRGSDNELDSTAKRTVAEMCRSRSADSKFGDMSRRRFGSDDLEEIFERATKEVGPYSGPSSGFSMSSSGSFVSLSSIRYGGSYGERESLDSILDTLLSDTEETYGIEISESVITALKNAVKLSVEEVSLFPVIRALYDDNVIDRASSLNGGEIPRDLIEAIRLTSLPPGT
jgi:hypothetical protein